MNGYECDGTDIFRGLCGQPIMIFAHVRQVGCVANSFRDIFLYTSFFSTTLEAIQ